MNTLAIADRLAIQDLLTAYAWALDTGETEALVQLFMPDARFVEEVFEDPDIWEGHDGIRKLGNHYFNSPGFPGRQHHVTNSVFMPESKDRVGIKSFAFVTECHGEPPYTLRFTGWYDDVVVRNAEGQWRFQNRNVRLWDGFVLKNFPGRGQWTPRKRPPELIIKR
jgi:SnoaL-like domain